VASRQPTILFDASTAGSEKYFSLGGSFASLEAAHVFYVGRRVSSPPPTTARTGLWALTTYVWPVHLPFTDGNIYDSTGAGAQYNCGAPVASLTSAHCYEVRASTSWQSRLNGSTQYTSASNTFSCTATPELGAATGHGVYYDGCMTEVVLFDRILTDPERAMIVEYFNARYALAMV
jgi:hypothetical protein